MQQRQALLESEISRIGKRHTHPGRPRSIEDVAYQDDVIAVLRKTLQGADLPNMLFYGPPGTGKTSTILAAARELYGADMFRDRVLELNASDERGIQVIRDKVKNFAQLSAGGTRPDGKPCPPFKIIILDEADSMTQPAQAALRRTMEKQSKTTRFCLICNYVSRIIEPITSRCSKFRFKPLANEILLKRLKEICEKENVKCDEKGLEVILDTSEGDMRKAITTLQSASRLKLGDTIVQQDIYEISGVIPSEWIDKLMAACQSSSYEKLEAIVKEMMLEGHSAGQILIQVFDSVIPSTDLNDKQKSVICERIAVADKCLQDGADEYLQVMDVCTVIMWQKGH
ncbi:PREDICTED: replication factor C subunit 4-like isoform X2 [Priapulus caudatus]|uniref:Replication factor C subunit 4-like isoform X2 n=1 Tax=Priapulus caudatus TaxID=37621 RepID=A0ABM1EBA2_PRICU|nr:PREDICTED: replication factor C subunit 4-like isoform X2 [Priapulus caudatus]XP_014669474.1 PREDICTED: replication factor C subunit 4-like isoform X2 [Priapulus caudatus]XP_014669475.1 PREDICTED: replication factor C subunit 4-like isoform X2 [Priapulus caudatus]